MTPTQKPMTKTEVLNALAERTGLERKQVDRFFNELSGLIGENLKQGPGVFTIPGLMKVKVVRKEATPERKGVNPFTGEETVFAAKPARNTVRVTPLKGLKEMV